MPILVQGPEGAFNVEEKDLQTWLDRGYSVPSGAGENTLPSGEKVAPTVQRYTAGNDYYSGLNTTAPTQSEQDKIRENERLYIQSQIDMINNQAASAISGQEQTNKETYAKTRAIVSSAGLLESPIGNTTKSQTTAYGNKQINLLKEEQTAKINALFEKADQNAQARIDTLTNKRQANAKELAEYQDKLKGEAKDIYIGLKKQGFSYDQIKDSTNAEGKNYLESALEQTGMDAKSFEIWYKSQPGGKIEFKSEKAGNKIIFWEVNSDTGEIKRRTDLDVETPNANANAGQYDTQITADGTVLLFPKVWDPNKSADEQIIQYGKKGEFGKLETPNKLTPEEIKSSIDAQLKTNNAFGSDNKVAWETYLWMYQNWINNGGTKQSFDANYPIGQYLDEDNQWEFSQRTNP